MKPIFSSYSATFYITASEIYIAKYTSIFSDSFIAEKHLFELGNKYDTEKHCYTGILVSNKYLMSCPKVLFSEFLINGLSC
jgi:hypothetical protein